MIDRLTLAALARAVTVGHLVVRLPNGSTKTLTGSADGPEAEITLVRPGALGRALAGGVLGLLDAYMSGVIETTDLAGFLHMAASNQQRWAEQHPRLYAAGRTASKARSHGPSRVDTMAGHYNLGNEFYASWLDPSMTYSAARFSDGDDLAAAQQRKYETLIELADIRPGHSVLEIGTGWGGFSAHLAQMGCRVTTVTIAEEQHAYAKRRLAEEGLAEAVEVQLRDFTEVDGVYDRVVSVEMIESIAEGRWPDLFGVIHRSLAPGGAMGMQAIVIRDEFWDSYRSNPDFIRRYIFPGGILPSPGQLRRLVAEAGLKWQSDEAFGLDYARTLAVWHERFDNAWPEIERQGFDERFRRMWKAYLAYCEAGFRVGRIDVMQLTALHH